MNLKTYKIGLMVLLLGCMLACNINEIKPLNQLTKENVITNEASAQLVLNRVYNKSRTSFLVDFKVTLGYYGVEKERAGGMFGDAGFNDNNVQDDSDMVKRYYESNYAIVNEANYFIDLVTGGAAKGISDKRKKEMLSEAKYFRAFAHFSLLKAFGQFYDENSKYGIAVAMNPIEGSSVQLSRSSVKDAYDKIVADLTYATTHGRTATPNHYQISKTTAQALLAKVYLYMGDFEKAATNALAVINNTDGYGLETKYEDIFKNRWDSKEVLFAPFVDGNNERTLMTAYYFTGAAWGPGPNADLFKKIADKSDGSEDGKNDKRYTWAYKPGASPPYDIGKYPFSSFTSSGVEGNTFYYLRMGEVYLIYAEAEARRGRGNLDEALKRLNEIRARAGMAAKVKSDKTTFLADVRDEKMLELFSENSESYYDLVRYHALGNVDATSLKATLKKDKFIMPIPAVALAGNPKLIQNPSY